MTSIYRVERNLRRGGIFAAGVLLALAATVAGGVVVQADDREDAALRARLEPLATAAEQVLQRPEALDRVLREIATRPSSPIGVDSKLQKLSEGLQAIARAFRDPDCAAACADAAKMLLFWRLPQSVATLPLGSYPPRLEVGVAVLPKVDLSVLRNDSFELVGIMCTPTLASEPPSCTLRMEFEGAGECSDSMRKRISDAGAVPKKEVQGAFRFVREWQCQVETEEVPPSWLDAVVGAQPEAKAPNWSLAGLATAKSPRWGELSALTPADAMARLRGRGFELRDDVLLWGAAALGALVLLFRYRGVARAVRQVRAYGDRLPGDVEIRRPRWWMLGFGAIALTAAMGWFVWRLQAERTPAVAFAFAAVLVLVGVGFQGKRVERVLRWKR